MVSSMHGPLVESPTLVGPASLHASSDLDGILLHVVCFILQDSLLLNRLEIYSIVLKPS